MCLDMELPLDLTGLTFGFLTVISRSGTTRYGKRTLSASWVCLCQCGEVVIVARKVLQQGKKRYCSIERHKDEFRAAVTASRLQVPLLAPEQRKSKGHDRAYIKWHAMRARCVTGRIYAERGISVCDRWQSSFLDFLSDMGDPPSDLHSVDRIDTWGNYEPGNCQWALVQDQMENRRNTRWVEWDGERRKLVDLVRETGADLILVGSRLTRGWALDRALFTPVKKRGERAGPAEWELARLSSERSEKLMAGVKRS